MFKQPTWQELQAAHDEKLKRYTCPVCEKRCNAFLTASGPTLPMVGCIRNGQWYCCRDHVLEHKQQQKRMKAWEAWCNEADKIHWDKSKEDEVMGLASREAFRAGMLRRPGLKPSTNPNNLEMKGLTT